MQKIERNNLEIRKRQRDEATVPGPELNDLAASILARGLGSAPGAWWDSEAQKWVLCFGRRRVAAIDILLESKESFVHDGETFEPGFLPIVVTKPGMSEDDLFELELDENLRRLDLDWQDRAAAQAELHARRRKANPEQTIKDTAREVVERSLGTNKTLSGAETEVKQSVRVAPYLAEAHRSAVVAEHLNTNRAVANARNLHEAFNAVLKQEEERARAEIARRQQSISPRANDIALRHADLLTVLPSLDEGFVDLILTDPPYGINAGAAGFRGRTVQHHNYDDTFDTARSILKTICLEGFRVTKRGANMFIFTDWDHFDFLRSQSKAAGWVPFRTPIIWVKGEGTEGLAPWGSGGPRRAHDVIFYATKGQKGLINSIPDVLRFARVSRADRTHAAEKPQDLLKELIESASITGDFIFDPCCGSGSTLVAAKALKRRGLGLEIDEETYNTAMANVFGEKEENGNPK